MKHRSPPTAKVSWFGAASTAWWKFSSGTLPNVPIRTPFISPLPGGWGRGHVGMIRGNLIVSVMKPT